MTNYFTFLKRSSVSSFEAKHLFIVFTFISHYTDLIVLGVKIKIGRVTLLHSVIANQKSLSPFSYLVTHSYFSPILNKVWLSLLLNLCDEHFVDVNKAVSFRKHCLTQVNDSPYQIHDTFCLQFVDHLYVERGVRCVDV